MAKVKFLEVVMELKKYKLNREIFAFQWDGQSESDAYKFLTNMHFVAFWR
jgi:hypothetical protein